MQEPAQEHQPVYTKRQAYGISAGAVVTTAALAVTAPQTFAAGLGSLGTSSAVFITPVWRFIKSVNNTYTDISMYVGADWERLRGRHFGAPSHEKRDALANYKPTSSRLKAYGVLTVTTATTGLLAVYAPSVLMAAFGSIAISGASFTKPVIDLVQRVNELYVDTYNYVKGDLSKTKMVKPKPLVQDTNNEIDQSIYAPVEDRKKLSKGATYAILAGTVVAGGLLALAAPSLLVAAAGTIIGEAISYTSPALKFVKRLNHVYERTEEHVKDGLEIESDTDAPKPPMPELKGDDDDKPLNISKPMAYAIAAGALVAGVGMVIYAPAIVTAAIGGILGSASSFTTPVLKQVGIVNAFYIDASKHLKEDWQRLKGRQPSLLQKPAADASAPSVTAKPETEAPKVESPRNEFNTVAKPTVDDATVRQADFNKSAERAPLNDNLPKQDNVAQPTAMAPKPKQPNTPHVP